jgi:hypothetical protein
MRLTGTLQVHLAHMYQTYPHFHSEDIYLGEGELFIPHDWQGRLNKSDTLFFNRLLRPFLRDKCFKKQFGYAWPGPRPTRGIISLTVNLKIIRKYKSYSKII